MVFGFTTCCSLLLASAATAQSPAPLPKEPLECLIRPYTLIKLGSSIVGVLEGVGVDRGDHVAKGQAVARLESGVEEARVAVARARAEDDIKVRAAAARLEYQRRRLSRNEQLHERKVVSFSAIDENRTEETIAELELQEARFDLRLAKLELERARAVLERRTIRSPIDGIVVDRFLSPGEYVHEQAPILELARVDLLRVEAFLQIAHYGSIRTGMRAAVLPQQPVGGRYVAEVAVVDKLLDPASGTFRVRLTLPNENFALPAGVRCELRFLDE